MLLLYRFGNASVYPGVYRATHALLGSLHHYFENYPIYVPKRVSITFPVKSCVRNILGFCEERCRSYLFVLVVSN